MDDRLSWRERDRELLQSCTIFDLYRSRRTAADGRSGEFYLLEARDWVNVVPVYREGPQGEERLLMVRQFRQGIGQLTVEFPAGLVEAGEQPREAAQRELREETGREGGTLVPIGTIAPNPAFMNNWCHTFCAESLLPRGKPQLDRLELLEVVEIPLPELLRRIGTPPFLNAMTAVALSWYLRHRQRGF